MRRILMIFAFIALAVCSCTKDYVTPSNQSVLDNINIVVSDISEDYALVNISLSGEFGEGVVGNGICVAAGNIPSFNDDKYPNLDNSQNYSIELFGLQPGTTYYISYYMVYYEGSVKYTSPIKFTTKLIDRPIVTSKIYTYNQWENYISGVVMDENYELPYRFEVASNVELKSIRVYVREDIYWHDEVVYPVDEMDISGNYTFTYENQFSYNGKGHIIGNCTVFCEVENKLGDVGSNWILIHINSDR